MSSPRALWRRHSSHGGAHGFLRPRSTPVASCCTCCQGWRCTAGTTWRSSLRLDCLRRRSMTVDRPRMLVGSPSSPTRRCSRADLPNPMCASQGEGTESLASGCNLASTSANALAVDPSSAVCVWTHSAASLHSWSTGELLLWQVRHALQPPWCLPLEFTSSIWPSRICLQPVRFLYPRPSI